MNDKLLNKIKKEYKNTEVLLDIVINNYHNTDIYIRLDYYKKSKVYKLSWVDLRSISNDINSVISYEYIPPLAIEHLKKLITNVEIKDYKNPKEEVNLVTINSYLKDNSFNLSFNRYIPKELAPLFNIFVVIFDNLPRKLNGLLQEMGAIIVGKPNGYEETFKFDLFEGDIDKAFTEDISRKGKDYYDLGRVLFLEKVGDSYIAVVGGKALYVVIIKYNESTKETKIYCSCPCTFRCKHVYAVILAIRNNKFRKFFKITHKNDDMELLDRVMNFNFLLTIGIDDQNNNYLVIEDGLLKLLPVVNPQGKSEWLVLEDDENNTLTNRLTSILKE